MSAWSPGFAAFWSFQILPVPVPKTKRLDIRLYIIQKKVESSYFQKKEKKKEEKIVIPFLFDYLVVY